MIPTDLCRHWKVHILIWQLGLQYSFVPESAFPVEPGRPTLKMLRFLKLFAIIQYHDPVPFPLLSGVRTEENKKK